MAYLYLKALHIIFVVTWFAGIFYMPRLFIYNVEAGEKEEAAKNALREQFSIMMKRLWYGITWPSAILTLILGPTVMFYYGWNLILFAPEGRWLLLKLVFVVVLYAYFFFLHGIFKQQVAGVFKHTSQQLRVWNEVATILLVAIVMLVTVKQSMSFVWGVVGLILFIIVLMSAIKIYKIIRNKKAAK
ncbi:putative membrane protein [Filimonas lacunae]|uniref:Protoporphyrinogen IX oxidase n=1 Tax=Filimonas lacunae TaxID=477680 RepID=A0A173MNS0_9BACT|nr:CopD family protein [Filimonas lacunae]BAV09041.1 protoporphyrinogen IX oxidase, novel form HemJ [Filimonas lacunae]SIS66290.1 putative membrane protein [Filimonas lacunae]